MLMPRSADNRTPDTAPMRQGSVVMLMMSMIPSGWYQMMMLMPGLANSPMFMGVDVTEFLQLIENLFKHHQVISATDKLEHLLSYC